MVGMRFTGIDLETCCGRGLRNTGTVDPGAKGPKRPTPSPAKLTTVPCKKHVPLHVIFSEIEVQGSGRHEGTLDPPLGPAH